MKYRFRDIISTSETKRSTICQIISGTNWQIPVAPTNIAESMIMEKNLIPFN